MLLPGQRMALGAMRLIRTNNFQNGSFCPGKQHDALLGRRYVPDPRFVKGILAGLAAALTLGACSPAPRPAAGKREFVLLADSRAAIDRDRIDSIIESQAPGWNVRILAVPGATARLAACASWPSGCTSVSVGPHPGLAKTVSDGSIDAVGFLFGPNEVSAARGDLPPTWGGKPVPISEVKASWNRVLTDTHACWRLWATQQESTWAYVAQNWYGDLTTSLAAQQNDWVEAQGAAGRVKIVRWGETADSNVKQWWRRADSGSNLWFDRAKFDPQHPIAGGWGPVALASKFAEALNGLGNVCNGR